MTTDHDNPGGIHAPAPGENAPPIPIGDAVPGTNDYDRAVPMDTDAIAGTPGNFATTDVLMTIPVGPDATPDGPNLTFGASFTFPKERTTEVMEALRATLRELNSPEREEVRAIEHAATLTMAALIYSRGSGSPNGAFISARAFVEEAREQGYGAAEFLKMGSGII